MEAIQRHRAATQTCTNSSACDTGFLLRRDGQLGVVLPRSAFLAEGSRGFRKFLFESSTVERIDFLLNKGRWAFNAEPRYTVALLVAIAKSPPEDHRTEVAGIATSGRNYCPEFRVWHPDTHGSYGTCCRGSA